MEKPIPSKSLWVLADDIQETFADAGMTLSDDVAAISAALLTVSKEIEQAGKK